EFCADAVKGRDPVLDEVCRVTGAKELFRPTKQTTVMILPGEATARAKGLRNSRFVVIDGRGRVKASGHGHGAFRIREDRLLLCTHRKTAALRLVIHITRGSLIGQPFAHVSLIKPSAPGEFRGIRRPKFGQSPVEA